MMGRLERERVCLRVLSGEEGHLGLGEIEDWRDHVARAPELGPGSEGGQAAAVEKRRKRTLDQAREQIGAIAILDQLPDVVPTIARQQGFGKVVDEGGPIWSLHE